MRKTDNNRIARATGATIVNRVDDLQESDVGTQCGLFEIEKIGDEYFTFLTKCKDPKACTVLLRGPSKDVLNEIERNLQDAMGVARNVMFTPRLAPGGGATEMAVSVKLGHLAKSIEGVQQWPYRAVAEALEVIPRTLIQNAGGSPVRVLTDLRAKHAEGKSSWGINGDEGTIVDMNDYGVWEPEAIKLQSIKTAIEVRNPILSFTSGYYYRVHLANLQFHLVCLPAAQSRRHLQRQESGTRRWHGRRRRGVEGLVDTISEERLTIHHRSHNKKKRKHPENHLQRTIPLCQ